MRPTDTDGSPPSTRAFAPGKVILLGEHAAVYGYPALAGPIAQGVTVHLQRTGRPGILLKGVEGLSPVVHALRRCAQAFHVTGVEVDITGDLPTSVGLGSSGAVSVALVRAFAAAAQISMRPQGLIERASELERDFHGASSGIDPNVSFERRLIRYEKGRRGQAIRLVAPVEAIVWVVEPRGSTRERVTEIRELREGDPARFEKVFGTIGGLVEKAVEAIERGDLETVGAAMHENQELLKGLGLSTPGLDAACERLESLGAIGAKLTGAGGGGSIVALVPSPEGEEPGRAEALVATLAAEGRQAFVVRWEPFA